jgi:hypothetical protein
MRTSRELPQGAAEVTYEGDPVLAAGALARFAVSVEATFALPAGARIALARRWPSDWGTPQADDPAGVDFLRVDAGAAAPVRWWHERCPAWHPFDHVLFVELTAGLPARTRCTVRFGAQDGGSPGFRVQTFLEEASPLSVRLALPRADEWIELARPTVQVVGSAAHAIVLTAPSRVSARQPFELHVRAEDAWGNPAALAEAVHLDAPAGRVVTLPSTGWQRIEIVLERPGVQRLTAHTASGLRATSNPVEVVDGDANARLYWGDLHAQSVIGCGARAIDAYYRHARDFAACDFASHQANCFLVSNPEWDDTAAATAQEQVADRFVTLLGVEWSASSLLGGDHNLYFPGDVAPLHRCSHEFVADKRDLDTDLPHVDDLYAHYRGSDTLVAVHVGGRTADLRWHEPALDRLLEVHSTHATSDWFLLDALKRGYRMGVIAGSDGVDGRPGASHPGHMGVRNVRGGLTAVALPALSRPALWDALKSRHCYATTGPRILLSLTAGDATMGDEVVLARAAAVFDVRVEGTAPIETVEFFRDDNCIARADPMASGERSRFVRVAWSGASAPGNWQRARMDWNGSLRIEGTTIVAAQPWAFDTPDEGLRTVASNHVAWRSITAGDWDGVVLELADPSRAVLSFATAPMTLRASLRDLAHEPVRFAADAPSRVVELRRLPEAMPAPGWRGSFIAPTDAEGVHAYWIRVRQADGAFAWSSPVFAALEAA